MVICYYCRGQIEEGAEKCPYCGASTTRTRQVDKKPVSEQDDAEMTNKTMKLEAKVHFLSKDEGGRHTPVFVGYQPQFLFGTHSVSGIIRSFTNAAQIVKPGETANVEIELVLPPKDAEIRTGAEVVIRESGRLVGNGTVTKIY